MPRQPSFRIQSKNIFLTYPQCSLSKEECIEQLKALPFPIPYKYIRVASETHAEGSGHLRVLIQFSGKFQTPNCRFFDLVSPSRSAHFHPNIQGAKSCSDVRDYISKYGNYTDDGEFQVDGRSARGGQQSAKDVFAEAINSGSKEEALRIIREKAPRYFFLQYHNITSNLERIFEANTVQYEAPFPRTSFNSVPTELKQLVTENILNPAAHDGRSARGGVYAEAINSGSKEEALRIIREKAPRYFCLQYNNINSKLERIFEANTVPYEAPFPRPSFNSVPAELKQWVTENILNPAARTAAAAQTWKPKSLVLEGASRTGKTLWARSLGPHNYISGYVDLNPRVYSNDAWYNVIDDVDPHCLKHFKEFMGAQRDWHSKIKYGRPVLVKGGIPCIFLCNPGPKSSYKEFLDKKRNSALKTWASDKAVFVTLSRSLFHEI